MTARDRSISFRPERPVIHLALLRWQRSTIGWMLPAIALVCGAPDAAIHALASGPYATWKKSPHATFGLYMYTVSDIALGALCVLNVFLDANDTLAPTTTTALTGIAVHQFSYLSASIAAFGFRTMHIPSIITGVISTLLALPSSKSKVGWLHVGSG